MSAKWRRNKKRSNWSKVFRTAKKVENKKARTFRIKKCETKRHVYSNQFRLVKIQRDKDWKEPEPLADVIQNKDEVIIIAEVAGFKRENLKIQVKNQHLVLSAEVSDRKYYKSLNLPIGVIPDKIRTVCKNGVLEIRLKKAVEEKAVDRVAS
ncbi:Hsp20/alpha crystallin family protein [Candidatus Bathyarchaeota archaeon]|nr:Hsp20/alpha crystallin family protein [Candidatus Bathyarchaeota archaeon]